jgi:hypothetical protein
MAHASQEVVEVGSTTEVLDQGPAAAALRQEMPTGARMTCDRNVLRHD